VNLHLKLRIELYLSWLLWETRVGSGGVKLLIFLHYFVAGVYIAYGIVSWCYFSVAFSGERLADDAAQAVALHALGRQLFTVSPIGVIAVPLGVFVGGSALST